MGYKCLCTNSTAMVPPPPWLQFFIIPYFLLNTHNSQPPMARIRVNKNISQSSRFTVGMLFFGGFIKTVNLSSPILLCFNYPAHPGWFSISDTFLSLPMFPLPLPHPSILSPMLLFLISGTRSPPWNTIKWIFMRPPNTTDLSCCMLHKFLIDLSCWRQKHGGRDERERAKRGKEWDGEKGTEKWGQEGRGGRKGATKEKKKGNMEGRERYAESRSGVKKRGVETNGGS